MVLDPEALFSIKLSIKVASLSTLLVFTFGLPLSYIFATKEFPLKNLLDALMTLPVVLTPTVTGYILLLIFGKNGICLLYTSPSPRDGLLSRMPSSA
jgi:molybdate transport system permease protein